jgi:hypothetical protein
MNGDFWRFILPAAFFAVSLAGCSKKPDETAQASQPPAMKPASAHATAAAAAGGLKFTAPADWISEQPSSAMRQAQYRLPRAQGDPEDAEVVVYYFQGGGGGVQANIDRWIGQFSKADGSPATDTAKTSKREVHGIPLTVVDVSGTYAAGMGPMMQETKSKPNYRMLAAVAEATSGPWFIKFTGPSQTVAKWEPSFQTFLNTIQ